MRIMNRTLAVLMLFLILCFTWLPIVAAAEQEMDAGDEIPERYQYIQGERCKLSISGGTAAINSYVKGTVGASTKCEIELKLQRKVLFWWVTVETWTKTAMEYQASLNVTHAVESGKTYRAVAEFTVWNGSNSESATVISATVEAP